MAFATGFLADQQPTGPGERFGTNQIVLAYRNFEDGLRVGRFAKLDAGRLDNMDGSATPVIAGVVLRNVANPVEDLSTVDGELFEQVEALYEGLVTVRVKVGETPARFGLVYASNEGDADDGLATADDSDEPTGARFIEEVQPGVWLIACSVNIPTAVTNLVNFTPRAFDVAGVPDASEEEGNVIYVSDGADGEPVLAISDGTDWIALDGTGNAISDGE